MATLTPIRLIVGLGNPGAEYAATRHNVGAWFVEQLAAAHQLALKAEPKFHGLTANLNVDTHKCHLLIPSTFMNASGQAVRALCQFYQIPPEAVLVAHDDLDFPPGDVRLKQEGGHGGHNGLRDIMQHLKTDHFNRLRIGIGHPGDRSQVHNYVLNRPNQHDLQLIHAAIEQALVILPDLLAGNIQKAMLDLHSSSH